MALTPSQLRNLQWLDKHGGYAKLKGMHIVAGDQKTNGSASLPFLHLLLKGYVKTFDEQLIITDKGKSMVNPFWRAEKETAAARPCVWREGCKHPAVCDKQNVCVPGGEETAADACMAKVRQHFEERKP